VSDITEAFRQKPSQRPFSWYVGKVISVIYAVE